MSPGTEGGAVVVGQSMMEAVTAALSTVLSWCGTVVDAVLTGELSALLPLLAVGVAISALMLGVKCIKSFAWGT